MRNLLITMMFLGLLGFVTAQEHVQWRGENRDGKYPDTDLLDVWPENGPELLWHFEGLGDGHASAAVTESKVYTAGTLDGIGYVFAFDHNGSVLWKTEIGKSWTDNWNGVRSTPMIYKGSIYVMSSFGKLVCLDSESGAMKWNVDLIEKYDGRNIRWGVTENLLLADDKLFVTLGGVESNVIALDPGTGALIWKCKGNGEKSSYNSPAVIRHGGKTIIVTMTESSILGINAFSGELLWTHQHINEWSVHPNTPIYRDGFIYCVSGYGCGGVKLELSEDGSSVKELWRNASLDNQMGGVILLGDRLYGAGHNSRKLICLDWNTGDELFSSKDIQKGNSIFADEMLYCYDERGTVGLVKPGTADFNLVSSFKVPYGENQHWAHLVIHNKRLYVRHGTALMVYDIKK